ncbi:MAG: RluA family pseudouridine synthase [bacterium]|nr:RluA family pseudouridine synthase [bacterium]
MPTFIMTDLSKNILYEDGDILAINKPAGLIVHPDGRTKEPSVSGWFGEKYPESKDVGENLGDIERPGVVHRIDRETSGILLLAKTKIGYKVLKEQFLNREMEKIYHLFVYGNIKDNQGVIDLPIARSASNFRKWSAQRGVRGEKREAITYFKVLKRSSEQDVTFLEAKPKTGRTHQIRVHFKALHHSVVCDKLYGGRRSLGEGGCSLGFNRLALHARAITFKTVDGEKRTIEAPYPEDFARAMDII